MENLPFWWYWLGKMRLFHGYVIFCSTQVFSFCCGSWSTAPHAFELFTSRKSNIEFSPEKMRLRRQHGDFSDLFRAYLKLPGVFFKMTGSKSKHVLKTIDELSWGIWWIFCVNWVRFLGFCRSMICVSFKWMWILRAPSIAILGCNAQKINGVFGCIRVYSCIRPHLFSA